MGSIKEGETFSSFAQFNLCLESYKKQKFADYSVADSHSLAEMKKKLVSARIQNAPPELKYYSLKLKCVHGGNFEKEKKGTGKRKTSSRKVNCPSIIQLNLSDDGKSLIVNKIIEDHNHEFRKALEKEDNFYSKSRHINCPASIHLKLSVDGKSLTIFKLSEDHNHECSPEVFNSLPKQRKLDKEIEQEVITLLELKADRRFVRDKYSALTKKNITIKEIHNLAYKAKKIKESDPEGNRPSERTLAKVLKILPEHCAPVPSIGISDSGDNAEQHEDLEDKTTEAAVATTTTPVVVRDALLSTAPNAEQPAGPVITSVQTVNAAAETPLSPILPVIHARTINNLTPFGVAFLPPQQQVPTQILQLSPAVQHQQQAQMPSILKPTSLLKINRPLMEKQVLVARPLLNKSNKLTKPEKVLVLSFIPGPKTSSNEQSMKETKKCSQSINNKEITDVLTTRTGDVLLNESGGVLTNKTTSSNEQSMKETNKRSQSINNKEITEVLTTRTGDVLMNESGGVLMNKTSDLTNKTGDVLTNKISDVTNEVVKVIDTDGTFSSHPNFEEIRQIQSKFVKDRNWDQYHQPRNLLLALVGEVGELSEIFQWRGEVKEGLPDWTEEEKEHLSQELSDVLIYLLRLSEKCHIDLPAAVLKKIALNEKKYPASKVWGSNKKYSEYHSSDNASSGDSNDGMI